MQSKKPQKQELQSTREETAKIANDLGLMPTIKELAKYFGNFKSITIYKDNKVIASYESEKINHIRITDERNVRDSSKINLRKQLIDDKKDVWCK